MSTVPTAATTYPTGLASVGYVVACWVIVV